MVSCTYAIGQLDFPDFFLRGKKGAFWRIPIYSNTKLALTLFTIALSKKVKEKGIIVNAADPGIVSTKIVRLVREQRRPSVCYWMKMRENVPEH